MKKNMKKKSGRIAFGAGALALAILIGGITLFLYRSYSTLILDRQKNQLMNIVESVSNSMEVYLETYAEESQQLVVMDQFLEAENACLAGNTIPMTRFLEQTIKGREKRVAQIDFYVDGRNVVSSAGRGQDFRLFNIMGDDETFQMLTIEQDSNGEFAFCIAAKTQKGNWLRMYIDARAMYANTSEYLHMGENGYVMIKDSSGIILMHQVEAQIGIDVLADRKKVYPNFDFSELEVLIAHQLSGETGVETYHSYWWADASPRKTKKVSAYMPLGLGDDFIITSAVVDYSEVAGEIQLAAVRILAILVGILAAGVILLWFMWRLMKAQDQKEEEIQNLRQQNEDLEAQRKREEVEAHQQRLELIGTMTSGIAHEFNNLLTPIMGYAALIQSGMSPEDESYADVQEIITTTEKAKEIISQINQFSSRGAEQRMQPIHVGRALQKALVITEAAKRRNITMVTDVQQTEDVCIGNPLQIEQMVINLCNNAIHAIGSEKGTLTVTGRSLLPIEKEDPFFQDKKDQWFYQIQVEDTGYGMSEETMAQIFVPFFTTKRPGEGTGLGLAVVSRMVEAHQGHICVHSKRGEGTVFRIYIPLIEAPQVDGEDATEE